MSSLFPDQLFLRLRSILLPAAVALLVPLLPVKAGADEVKLTPSASVSQQYNDNIYLVQSRPTGDFLSNLTGSLALADRAELHGWSLSGQLSRLDYYHHPSDSGFNYSVQGTGSLIPTQRLSLGAAAGYRRDSYFGTVDPVTGLATNSEIEHQNYSGNAKYALTEKATGSLSYGFTRDHYLNPGYLDTDFQQAQGELDYDLRRWFPRTTQITRLTLSRNQTDLSRVDGLTGTVGIGYDLSPRARLTANVGGRGTWSNFDVLENGSPVKAGTGSDTSGGWVGDISAFFTGVYFSGTLNFVHDLTSASGRAGATERTGGSLSLSERFTERLTGSAQAAWSWNKADRDQFSRTPVDELSRGLGCKLSYEVPDSYSLAVSYANTNIDYRLTGTTANQNVFMLTFSWLYPMYLHP